MLKKLFPDKINGAKNALFFFSRAPTHHSCTFDLRFLYELKKKFISLKLCVGSSTFDSVSFLLKFIFLFNKRHLDSLTLKRHNSFQNKNNKKAPHSSASRPLILKLQQDVLKFNDILTY